MTKLLERISGLNPPVWLCVGSGFAREDLKALVFSQASGLTKEGMITLEELCLKLTKSTAEQLLSPLATQELLRALLLKPSVLQAFPEIKKIRRQKNFLTRLDRALRAGRMTFSHELEEQVFEDRLIQLFGKKIFYEKNSEHSVMGLKLGLRPRRLMTYPYSLKKQNAC